MLAVSRKAPKLQKASTELISATMPQDIIALKPLNEKIEYNDDGSYVVKKGYKKVNITKYVNETKKTIKYDGAEEKLAELRKAVLEATK